MTSSLDNPSLAMAANAYRRIHGEWPTWARFAPEHFGHWATELDPFALIALATVLEVSVTTKEPSLRLTVGGPAGELTYDRGVTEADWEIEPFERWVREESAKRAPDL